MWGLRKVSAENVCAFKKLEYYINQGHCTLIFGHNDDNDSQKSNGSGKSALIECISVGTTGEILRDANAEEIINDSFNDATVRLEYENPSINQILVIERFFERKKSSVVKCYIGNEGNDPEPIIKSSVDEYNKFILDTLGLTKDDIFHNYILSQNKFKSFLKASDSGKKDIINNFSNGNKIDEAIELLHVDMDPVVDMLHEAEEKTSKYSGKVSAIEEQISLAEENEKIAFSNKPSKILELKTKISDERGSIRLNKDNISFNENLLGGIDIAEEELEKLEDNSELKTEEVFHKINEALKTAKINEIKDYLSEISSKQCELTVLKVKLDVQSINTSGKNSELSRAKKDYENLVSNYEKYKEDFPQKLGKVAEKLYEINNKITALNKEKSDYEAKKRVSESKVASAINVLAGVIVCPKCKHEFVLNDNVDVEEEKLNLESYKKEVELIDSQISKSKTNIEKANSSVQETEASKAALLNEKNSLANKITELSTNVSNLNNNYLSLSRELDTINSNIESINSFISGIRGKMFDEAYQIVDDATSFYEAKNKTCKSNISVCEGSIASYEESIENLNKPVVDSTTLGGLKKSLEQYKKDYSNIVKNQEEVAEKVEGFKAQEALYVDFKTYLANKKIDSLSDITNKFLEKIGSDIRISFSGYTVLKSGKIRDKISISLLRDGVDCGSFGKFSEGEKVRVNMANILAMHQLTNENCDTDKGLDLLIVDDILGVSDESGIESMAVATDTLGITVLMISQMDIAENYPYRTMIRKTNGISKIEE